MDEALQQLAILDALLTNWEVIKLRMGPLSPALNGLFDALGQKLRDAPSTGDLARIVDDLLDLTSGTAAETYVNELVARSDLGGIDITREEGVVRSPAGNVASITAVSQLTQKSAASFGIVLSQNELVVGAARVPIFFSTNRKGATSPSKVFSGDPQKTLTFGVATVTVPVSHKSGKLETPAWWNLLADKKDEKQYFTLSEVSLLQQMEFEGKLASASQAAKTPDLLIFLHGFNVTFEEAALRAAQFVCDSRFTGVVVLFSWPSQGTLLGYSGDEDRALSSGDQFAAFLSGLEAGPWRRVHLLAHSMGNRVMLLGLADNSRPKLALGQLVFAAADVYVAVFDDKFAKLQNAGVLSATSYASKDDRALIISNILHSGTRVGLVGDTPYVTDRLASIDATRVDKGVLGHGYWSEAPALLSDLQELLDDGLSPKDRKLDQINNYWAFPK